MDRGESKGISALNGSGCMRKNVFVLLAAVIIGVWGFWGTEAVAAEESAAGGHELLAGIDELLGEAKEKISQAFEKIDEETAGEMFDFVKEKVADGSLKTEEGLSKAIEEGENKFGVNIDKEDAEKVVAVMEKLEDMGFSGEYVIDKAKELYGSYGAEFIEHAEEAVEGAVEDAVTNAISSFFHNLWEEIKTFFENLFKNLFGGF